MKELSRHKYNVNFSVQSVSECYLYGVGGGGSEPTERQYRSAFTVSDLEQKIHTHGPRSPAHKKKLSLT